MCKTWVFAGVMLAAMVACAPLFATTFPVDDIRQSYVSSNTVYIGGGLYEYNFTVHNLTPPGEVLPSSDVVLPDGDYLIVNWELPLFDLDALNCSTITSPTHPNPDWPDFRWYYEVVVTSGPEKGKIICTDNPDKDPDNAYPPGTPFYSDVYGNANGFYGEYEWSWTKEQDRDWIANNDVYGPDPDAFLNPPYLLHWYSAPLDAGNGPWRDPAMPIWPGESLSGFGFTSTYSAVAAPYQDSWFLLEPTFADPDTPGASFAGSPASPNNPNQPLANDIIPEPMSMALLGLGMMGLGRYMRRRRA